MSAVHWSPVAVAQLLLRFCISTALLCCWLAASEQCRAPARRAPDGRCRLDSGAAALDLPWIRVRRTRLPEQLQRRHDHVMCGRLRGCRRLHANSRRHQASLAQIRAAAEVTIAVQPFTSRVMHHRVILEGVSLSVVHQDLFSVNKSSSASTYCITFTYNSLTTVLRDL